MTRKLISFDWAIKKLLRNKANFDILEGFLSELLGFDVVIKNLLESEANLQDDYDKYNRVDILVEDSKGELMLIEVQNDPEIDFFHRMLFGVSKLVTEYINKGDAYSTIKKIYSISIVYFGLGQGDDYIYDYKGAFVGRQLGDVMQATSRQKDKFKIKAVADIFPKYIILKVNNFNDIAKNTLDEWIYFLKNSEIKTDFKAKGLETAAEKLRYEGLSREEKLMYQRFEENRMIEKSVITTAKEDGLKQGIELGMEMGMEKGIEQTIKTVALQLIKLGMDDAVIAQTTNLSLEEIKTLRNQA